MTDLQLTKDRIRRIAAELSHGCEVRFDEQSELVRFVVYTSTGVLLVPHSEDRTPQVWAEWSDDEVRNRLKLLSHGLM